MSAMGQKQTRAAHGSCPPRAKGGSHFKVCWAGKLVIGDHVTGFLISARRGPRFDPDIIGEAKPTAERAAAGSKRTEARYGQASSHAGRGHHLGWNKGKG